MDAHRVDLGFAIGLDAESFGEPGQRTFRLLVRVERGSVSLWLEKEQLAVLDAAITELLQRVPAAAGLDPAQRGAESFLGDLDVKVGTLALGYDREDDAFPIAASNFVADLPIESIAFLAGRRQLERLTEQIRIIVQAGRPRCVLCGHPLGAEPHFCPQSNGHAHLHDEE